MVDAMRDDLGIGLGAEAVAQFLEPDAQLIVILDDAVVHEGDAVARNLRMRIAHGGHAMGRPAGMRDPDGTRDRSRLERLLQDANLADRAQAFEHRARGQDREPRRIVAAIFQPAQAFQENGNDITFCDDTNDSTHRRSSSHGSAGLTVKKGCLVCPTRATNP